MSFADYATADVISLKVRGAPRCNAAHTHVKAGLGLKVHPGGNLPFGTGQGKNMTPSPVLIEPKGQEPMIGFTELQRKEESPLLLITDSKATRVLHRIEAPTDTLSGLRTYETNYGTVLAAFGSRLVSPVKGDEFLLIDPKTGKVREFLLPSGAKDGHTIFPLRPGDPLMVFDGKSSFQTFDPTFVKPIGSIEIQGLETVQYDQPYLLRVPGTLDKVIRLSREQMQVINLTTKVVEQREKGNFRSQAGLIETFEGPILYRTDFLAAPDGRKNLYLINLATQSKKSLEIGETNDQVGASTLIKNQNPSALVFLIKNKDQESRFVQVDLKTGLINHSKPLPTTVERITLIPQEGQEPLLLFTRPGFVQYREGETDPKKRFSYGYLYKSDGTHLASFEMPGGLKASPVVIQEKDHVQIRYQNLLYDVLSTLIVR